MVKALFENAINKLERMNFSAKLIETQLLGCLL